MKVLKYGYINMDRNRCSTVSPHYSANSLASILSAYAPLGQVCDSSEFDWSINYIFKIFTSRSLNSYFMPPTLHNIHLFGYFYFSCVLVVAKQKRQVMKSTAERPATQADLESKLIIKRAEHRCVF